jgi:short-subunit dehydrogenase
MARRTIQGCRGILTGASSGIGRALAGELVRGGARLVLISRRADRLEQLAATLAGASGRVEIVAGDVTQDDVRRRALERAAESFGGLDLLVNNAGSGAMGLFVDASPERLRQIMEINFFAPAEMIRLALPMLEQGNKPMVVNVGSVLGHRGVPYCSEYCASKFALHGLGESLRAEFARLKIDLLTVSPARTATEFFEQAVNPHLTQWPAVKGISPEIVARKTVRAIRQGRHEVVITASGKLLVWASRLFPRVMDAALARKK